MGVFLRQETTVAEFLKREQQVTSGPNAMLSRRLDAFKADTHVG